MSRWAVGVALVLGGLLATGLSVSLLTRHHVVIPQPVVNRATDGCVQAWNRTGRRRPMWGWTGCRRAGGRA